MSDGGGWTQVDAILNLLRYACCEDKYDFYWLISGQDFPLAKPQEILSYLSDNAESNFMQLAKTKNNGVGYNTSFDKRNEIIFPDWMMRQSLCFRILRRAWVEISGGYKKTFSFFKRKDENHLKYYFGSTWWCVNRTMTKYIFYFLQNNPQYSPFFTLSSCPDECFFQTILMNSKYSQTRKDYLHYIDWSEKKFSPKTLTCADLDSMFSSGKLMARKIDMQKEPRIIEQILIRLNQEPF